MKIDTRKRFLKVAQARTNKVLDQFRLIGNMANKANYHYNEIEVDKIFKVIEEAIFTARAQFNGQKVPTFSLDEKLPEFKVKEEKMGNCKACKQFRQVTSYRGLWLCDRDWRSRKQLHKISLAVRARE